LTPQARALPKGGALPEDGDMLAELSEAESKLITVRRAFLMMMLPPP